MNLNRAIDKLPNWLVFAVAWVEVKAEWLLMSPSKRRTLKALEAALDSAPKYDVKYHAIPVRPPLTEEQRLENYRKYVMPGMRRMREKYPEGWSKGMTAEDLERFEREDSKVPPSTPEAS